MTSHNVTAAHATMTLTFVTCVAICKVYARLYIIVISRHYSTAIFKCDLLCICVFVVNMAADSYITVIFILIRHMHWVVVFDIMRQLWTIAIAH
jgi:hypothetical protein